MIPISEIKYSISGEGKSAGYPVIIVRTAGCNFTHCDKPHPCSYCDTDYSWYTTQGTKMSEVDILSEVRKYPCSRVLLTGGEPLMHDIGFLLLQLLRVGYKLEIETNGSINFQSICCIGSVDIVMDVKTPSSSNELRNCYANLGGLCEGDQVKFVIGDRADFDFALHVLKSYRSADFPHVLFSPVWGKIEGKALAEWIMNDYPEGQLSLQIHKVIGVA